MSEAPPAQSMEAILASIKRIIAEPPAGGAAQAEPVGAADEPAAPRARWTPDDDVLELGGAMAAAPAAPAPPPAAPEGAAPATAKPATLVSTATREASTRAMAALAAVTIDPAAADHTLDGLVRELLRPMLREWLDANLPDLVERVVAREVARLGAR